MDSQERGHGQPPESHNLSLKLIKYTAQAQGKAMGYLVATQYHLRLMLANLPHRERVPLWAVWGSSQGHERKIQSHAGEQGGTE